MQGSAFPQSGRSWNELEQELTDMRSGDADWRRGRVPLYVFFAGEDVLDVATKAYVKYMSENALGPAAFPSLKRMEDEVIAMALDLLHAPRGASGGMTSGGSESIFLAMKAARDWARAERPTDNPEVIAPVTAHPAFSKAAHYLGLRLRRVPIRADFRGDPAALEAAITPDTIMMVGSAVAFPHGVVDPIREIAAIAEKNGLWMHVDACVGGYSAPFVRELGYPVPDFDFAIPGVTTISADLHKYGFTAKGASTVLYRDEARRAYQAFEFSEWPKGKYRTMNLCGTRPGGAVAAAWAVMNYLGRDGYKSINSRLIKMRDRYIEGITAIGGLQIWGKPDLGIITYGSTEFDIYAVAEVMAKDGWYPSVIAEPAGIHLMLSLAHEPVLDEYLDSLSRAVRAVKSGANKASGRLMPVTY